jgi:hypothetical protein
LFSVQWSFWKASPPPPPPFARNSCSFSFFRFFFWTKFEDAVLSATGPIALPPLLLSPTYYCNDRTLARHYSPGSSPRGIIHKVSSFPKEFQTQE